MRKLLIVLCVAAAMGFSRGDPAPQPEPTPHQKAYYLEHRLLPQFTHKSEGRFYSDLEANKTAKLDVILKDYLGAGASATKIEVVKESNLVIVELPEPKEPVECYYVAIAKVERGYRYFTLEKTEDIMNTGVKACFCEWSSTGSHLNMGPTSDVSKGGFKAAVLNTIKEGSDSRPAASFTPKTAE